MEIKELSLKATYIIPTINVTSDDLEAAVAKLKQKYANWIVAEKDIKAAKDIKADINNLIKSINDNRISIKKAILAPIDIFEQRIKNITNDLESIVSNIASGLEVFENKRKEDAESQIRGLPQFKSWMIFNPKWLNKSTKLSDVLNDISTQQEKYDSDTNEIIELCKNNEIDHTNFIQVYEKGTSKDLIIKQLDNAILLVTQERERLARSKAAEKETVLEPVNEAPVSSPVESPVVESPVAKSPLGDTTKESFFVVSEPNKVRSKSTLSKIYSIVGTEEQLQSIWNYAVSIGAQIKNL